LKMFGNIEPRHRLFCRASSRPFCPRHTSLLLEHARQLLGARYVSSLRTLVASTQQQKDRAVFSPIVDAVSGARMDSHFRIPAADALAVTNVSLFQHGDSREDSISCLLILEPRKPSLKRGRLMNLEHRGGTVTYRLHFVKCAWHSKGVRLDRCQCQRGTCVRYRAAGPLDRIRSTNGD
jgi:hypothetical protein